MKNYSSIAKYTVFYSKKIPEELESFSFNDRNSSLTKEGLGDFKGFRSPKLSLALKTKSMLTDKNRILALEELLKMLFEQKKIEHFVRVS